MYNTSAFYPQMMSQDLREPTIIEIVVGRINESAAEAAEVTDSDRIYYSDLTTILTGPVPENTYTTWEPGRWTCGGNGVLPSRVPSLKQGYASYTQAGDDGVYATQPGVFFQFNQTYTIEGLTFTFDPSHSDYPEQIHIKGIRDGEVVTDEDAYPDAPIWEWKGVLGAVSRVEITFVKAMAARRRARLQLLAFGDGIVFKPDRIVNAYGSSEIDPISRRLPEQALGWSIENLSNDYDPDNPQNVWKKLLQRNPVNVRFIQETEAGVRFRDLTGARWDDLRGMQFMDLIKLRPEVIPAGLLYLTSRSTVDDGLAHFSCVDFLSLLSDEYIKGPVGGGTLYDLALDILRDANLPLTTAGEEPWVLWEGLRNISTKCPLPIDTGRNLLQRIAHAACCVLFVDRLGFIHIEPMSETQHDLYLEFDEIQIPKAEIIESLKQVNMKVHTYNIPSEPARQIHEEKYSVSGSTRVDVDFGGACTGVTVSASPSSALTSYTIYARKLVATLSGNGDVTLTVNGKKIDETTTTVSVGVSGAEPSAETEEQDNPLITDTNRGLAVARWVRDWLVLRNTYTMAGRGRPEIDPADLIYGQTAFTKKMRQRVLKQEWEWDGAYSDEITAKGYT